MNLSSDAQSFLWYSYFAISYDELAKDSDAAMLICAQRAYLDMNRTLTFVTDKEEDRREFRDSVCEEIVGGIRRKLFFCDPSDFDKKHSWLCKHIMEFVQTKNILVCRNSNTESFCYGQAQKWLNMTFKYMLIMGFWSDELSSAAAVIHIPVDSYIMEAASKIGVKLPKRNGAYDKYSASSKPWSKWNEEEYQRFQDDLRTALKNRTPGELPIEWESRAWIEIAQSRNL